MRLHCQRHGILFLGVAMLGVTSVSHAANRFELAEDDVVVFVGGANMLHLQQAGYLEALLTREFAAARPKFRDLSWEADTVFRQGTVIERWRQKAHFGDLGGLGDLDGQLKRLGATVVVAQFGALESMAGTEGLDEFAGAYKQLVDTCRKQARVIVLVTPTPFERPPSPLIPDRSQRNAELARYVEAIKTIAVERELVFVDLFTETKTGLTDNGMHVRPVAQATIAREIAGRLGLPIPEASALEPLRQAVIEKHRLWYDYWRPANWKLIYGDDARRQFTRGGKVGGTKDRVVAAANDGSRPIAVRAAAFQAMADIKLQDGREMLVGFAEPGNDPSVRSAAIQALADVEILTAAQSAAELFTESDTDKLDPAPVLAALLNRQNGAGVLAVALRSRKLTAQHARRLLLAMYSIGRSDASLLAALDSALGSSAKPPDYSEELVSRVVTDAAKQGAPERGSVLFKSMACSSCHKVSGAGGNVGPDLTAIGTTLSAERIVEELLWPNRQIKEGFSVVQVATVDGKILSGYERTSKESGESGDLVIEELATGKRITLAKQQIEEKHLVGSPMPTGLTALLAKDQLLDLIQYVAELGKIK